MKLNKMSDKDCLDAFIDLMEDRVTLETGFTSDDGVNLTHQVIRLTSGELVSTSQPERLAHPLRLATAEDLEATVN